MINNFQITENSVNLIVDNIFKKYSNNQIIKSKEAIILINELYKSFGIEYTLNENEGDELIKLYSNNKDHLNLDDFKNIFKKYLCCNNPKIEYKDLRNDDVFSFNNDTNIKNIVRVSEYISNNNSHIISPNYHSHKPEISKSYYINQSMKNKNYENNIKSKFINKSIYLNTFFDIELSVLQGDKNYYLLKKLYYELIDKYGQNIINNSIKNYKELFKEYDFNRNNYLDKDEIKLLLNDTYKKIKEDNYYQNENSIENYIKLLTNDKNKEKISLTDYLVFVLKSLNK